MLTFNVWAVISMRSNAARLMVRPTSVVWDPFLQMAPGCEIYAVRSCTSFSYEMHCVAQIPVLMFDVGSCFLTCCMVPTWCDAESFVGCTCCHDSSRFLWDPFVVCWWDTHVSPCMFALRSLLCHVGGILIIIMHDLCHTDRSPFWLRVPVAEHLLELLLH